MSVAMCLVFIFQNESVSVTGIRRVKGSEIDCLRLVRLSEKLGVCVQGVL